ncbi:ribonuclease P protein component [Nitratidesulfovibrio sp. D1]|uniref:ribonuclease P protein component n=1 Tax=Nitratidesulfovibrio sp. D1 TaxID=3440151 RepID=UPI003EBA5FF9
MSSLVFPRRNRLVRRPDYVACYDKGRRLFSKHFVLFVLFDLDRTASPEGWRLGLAVTRKTGSAVRRNRVKRVLREFFRLHRALLPDGVDVIAVPKRHLKPERVTLALVTRELLPLLAELRAHHGADDRTGPHGPKAVMADGSGPEPSGPEPSGPGTAAPCTAAAGATPTDEARPVTAREAETGAQ